MSKVIKDILQNENKFCDLVRLAFDSVDEDKSGSINAEELNKIMTQITTDIGVDPLSKEDVNKLLKHYDSDGNGDVDFDEYSVLIRDVLEAMLEL